MKKNIVSRMKRFLLKRINVSKLFHTYIMQGHRRQFTLRYVSLTTVLIIFCIAILTLIAFLTISIEQERFYRATLESYNHLSHQIQFQKNLLQGFSREIYPDKYKNFEQLTTFFDFIRRTHSSFNAQLYIVEYNTASDHQSQWSLLYTHPEMQKKADIDFNTLMPAKHFQADEVTVWEGTGALKDDVIFGIQVHRTKNIHAPLVLLLRLAKSTLVAQYFQHQSPGPYQLVTLSFNGITLFDNQVEEHFLFHTILPHFYFDKAASNQSKISLHVTDTIDFQTIEIALLLAVLIIIQILLWNIWKLVGMYKQFQLTEQSQRVQLEKLARKDPLTALWNKKHFNHMIQDTIEYNLTKCFSIIFLDVDNFKQINDRYGHSTGDKVLLNIARRIRSSIRTSDFAARWGGDEFIILLQDTHPGVIDNILETLKSQLYALPYTCNQHQFTLSISLGTSFFPEDSTDIATLIQLADQRMYKKKMSRL